MRAKHCEHHQAQWLKDSAPLNIYLFKVNNRSTRGKCEICAKQIKVIDVVLVRYCIPFSSASILDFEQVNVGLVGSSISLGVLVYILQEIYRNCDF